MEFTIGGITVNAATFIAALEHVEKYHPVVYKEYVAGRSGVKVSDPDEQVRIEVAIDEDRFQKAVLLAIEKVLLNHENRLRAVEGKPQVTAETFRGTLKIMLGLN